MTDRELLELLLSKVSSMEAKMNSMETRMSSMETKMNSIETDIKELREGQVRIENKLDNIEANNADRHITLNGKIDQIAEIQINHIKENERQHKEMMDTVQDKTDLITEVVKHIAGETTMHTVEISFLKRKMG